MESSTTPERRRTVLNREKQARKRKTRQTRKAALEGREGEEEAPIPGVVSNAAVVFSACLGTQIVSSLDDALETTVTLAVDIVKSQDNESVEKTPAYGEVINLLEDSSTTPTISATTTMSP